MEPLPALHFFSLDLRDEEHATVERLCNLILHADIFDDVHKHLDEDGYINKDLLVSCIEVLQKPGVQNLYDRLSSRLFCKERFDFPTILDEALAYNRLEIINDMLGKGVDLDYFFAFSCQRRVLELDDTDILDRFVKYSQRISSISGLRECISKKRKGDKALNWVLANDIKIDYEFARKTLKAYERINNPISLDATRRIVVKTIKQRAELDIPDLPYANQHYQAIEPYLEFQKQRPHSPLVTAVTRAVIGEDIRIDFCFVESAIFAYLRSRTPEVIQHLTCRIVIKVMKQTFKQVELRPNEDKDPITAYLAFEQRYPSSPLVTAVKRELERPEQQ